MKKTNSIWKGLCVILSFLLVTTTATAQFSGGSGVNGNPWLIATAQDFDEIRNHNGISGSPKYFKLIADIDLNSVIGSNPAGWDPIGGGRTTTSFSVDIDGDNHIITGLWINQPTLNNVALFGQVDLGTTIKNLGVIIDDNKGGIAGARNTAGLIGYSDDIISIQNCYVVGNIKGTTGVGALIGYQQGTISNSYASGEVIYGTSQVGGLVGYQGPTRADILNSYVNNRVKTISNTDVGGIVGLLSTAGSTISSFFNKDLNPALTAVGSDPRVEPNAGKTTAELIKSNTYSGWGTIFTSNFRITDGLTFPYFSWQVRHGRLSDDYVPTATYDAGAGATAIALNVSLITVPYNTTNVTFDVTPPRDGSAYFEKTSIVLTGTASVLNTIYSTSQIGIQAAYIFNVQKDSPPIFSVTFKYPEGDVIVQATNSNNYVVSQPTTTSADYDILGWYTNATYTQIWNFATPVTANIALYPKIFQGKGTAEKPYLIHTQAELAEIQTNLTAYYKLANDINLALSEPNGWTPIASFTGNPTGATAPGFTGTFDGDGHKITGLWVNATTTGAGLFASLRGNVVVKNLGIEIAAGKSISSGTATSYAGGLTGFANGSNLLIDNVYVIGGAGSSITNGSIGTGGLVGGTSSSGANIKNSYAAVSVIGIANSTTGGLVGVIQKNSTPAVIIENSYATGNVTSIATNVGGLVGQASLEVIIKNSYATGNVSSTNTLSGNIGGLVGYLNLATIENSYANPTNLSGAAEGADKIGNLVGAYVAGSIYTNAFAVAPAAGTILPTGVTEITPEELKQAASYSTWDITTSNIWGIYEGYGTPYLKSFSNNTLISPAAVAPATYTRAIITTPALSWTASDNYNAQAHAITGALAYDAGATFINAGDYQILPGTVDLKNPYYQISFKDDVVFTINKATQSITFNPPTSLTLADSPYTLTATATSGSDVTFTISSGDEFAEIEYNNGVATLILNAIGVVEITTSVEADANYEDATPVSRQITITDVNGIGSLQANNLVAKVETGGVLKVTGLTSGFSVYTIQGIAIYSQATVVPQQSIQLPAHGIYVLVAGDKKVKVVY